jgi:hypothetical protein
MNIPELAQANWEQYNKVASLANPYGLPHENHECAVEAANKIAVSRRYSYPGATLSGSQPGQSQNWRRQSLMHRPHSHLLRDALSDASNIQVISSSTRSSGDISILEAETEITDRYVQYVFIIYFCWYVRHKGR